MSGCHGDLLACKYGQHAPCDNSHMAVLQQGFRFVTFLFMVSVVKSLSVYICDAALYYVLSDSQF